MQTSTTLKIIIVEDDATMRSMLEDFIKEKYHQAEISCFATGEEAMRNILTAPDLVILDYNLDSVIAGGMNGIEALKKMKEKFPKVDVVFLSGQEKPEVAANTMKHGARDYIIKNEKVFQRLEITLNNIFGKEKIRKNVPANTKLIKTILIIAVTLLIVIIWKKMK